MKKTSRLTEGAMAAALFAVLLIITLYVPVIRVLSVLVLPLPFVVYVVRNGFKSALPLWGASFVVAFIIGGIFGVFSTIIYASGGIVAGLMYHQRRSAFSVLLGGSLAYTAGIIAVFILTVVFLDFNMISNTIQLFDHALNRAENMTTQLGENPKAANQNFDLLHQSLEIIRYLAPLLFVLLGVGYALITQLIAGPLLKRLGLGEYVASWLPFREWHFPKSFLWYYLIFLVIGFFQHFETGSIWYIGYYNLLTVFQLAMLIQGFSFIFFFFHEKKVSQ
ncbi:MAG TPA: YybS family protein, partial [Bacillales bacterium]|nr:YybS family protein [Bacillales bacterium]